MLIFLFIFYSFYLENDTTPPPRNTLIFIDKTESVKYVGTVLDDAKAQIKDIIVKHFYREKDKIVVYFIHGFTAGTKAYQKFEISLPNCDNKKLPKLHYDACLKSYKKKVNIERNTAVSSIYNALETEVGQQSKNSTDIIGAIEMVCNYKKNNVNNAELHVYIFSDMIQTSNLVNLKNMAQLTLTNLNIKIEKDLKIIKSNYFYLQKDILENVKVYIKTPDLAINSSAQNKNLKYYWEKVLKGLGVKTIIWNE